MKIVINIPEKTYKELTKYDEFIPSGNRLYDSALLSIYNGTPLPEHHGKLKDADELYSIFKENCNAYNIDNLSFISDMDMNFDLVPTIIEGEVNVDEDSD